MSTAKRSADRAGSALSLVLAAICAISLALVAIYAFRWWSGEERVVRGRLDSLAETLSAPAGGELATVGRLAQLRGYFAPDVLIHFGGEDIVSRDALLAVLGRWEAPSKGFTLEFVDVSVDVAGDQAQVSLTAKVSNVDAGSGESIADAREGHLTMSKIDGDWVITSVEATETLRR